MLLPRALRRASANLLALAGAFSLVGAVAALRPHAWRAGGALLALAAGAWWAAFRLNRPARSRAAIRGGPLVLFETPMPGVTRSRTPALTIRGARDAVEAYIPLAEFGALFGGWALWAPPARPAPDLPGEALGVWSRRACQRFRRVLRERGATLEVRREPGPAQRLAQAVSAPEAGAGRPRGPAA